MKILIVGETDDYSVLTASLKLSGFKRVKELVSIKGKIHGMLECLAAEKSLKFTTFHIDWQKGTKLSSDKKYYLDAPLHRDMDALKYCNGLIVIGKSPKWKERAEKLKKKIFEFEFWKDDIYRKALHVHRNRRRTRKV